MTSNPLGIHPLSLDDFFVGCTRAAVVLGNAALASWLLIQVRGLHGPLLPFQRRGGFIGVSGILSLCCNLLHHPHSRTLTEWTSCWSLVDLQKSKKCSRSNGLKVGYTPPPLLSRFFSIR